MKRLFVLIFYLFIWHLGWAQEKEQAQEKVELAVYAEIMPEFPGGVKAMETYLKANSIYPIAKQAQINSGKETVVNRVMVSFVVETSGKLTGIAVKSNSSKEYANEAVRLVSNMPRWRPASNDGQTVSMKMFVPILFK